MTTNPTRRRGRPADYVTHNGQPIVGLSRMPATVKRKRPDGSITEKPDGRYYATASNPRTYFGADFASALQRFEAWQARQRGETFEVAYPAPPDPAVKRAWRNLAQSDKPETAAYYQQTPLPDKIIKHRMIPADTIWTIVAAEIRKSPERAARKLGIPEIAYLSDLRPRTKLSLEKAGARYFADHQFSEQREHTKCSDVWDEFVRIVGRDEAPATHVEDLTNEVLQRYANRVRQDQGERGAWYRRLRFITVKAVLNYAFTCQLVTPETHTRLRQAWKAPLKTPKQAQGTQVTLTPAEVAALLRAAPTPHNKALFLLALNAALYPVDIRRLQWRHLHLDDGTLIFRRAKKDADGREGTLRVAVLWQRTVKSLRCLKGNATPSPDAYVFSVADDGAPVHVNTVQDYFRSAHAAAKIKRDLSFSNLRDSAITVASRAVSSAVFRVVAGHKIKDEDAAYIEANPFYVADACRAIEDAYFPAPAPAAKGKRQTPTKTH